VTPERLRLASAGTQALGWRVEDHVMVSDAWNWRDGVEAWAVEYDCDKTLHEIKARGDLPPEFRSVVEEAQKVQAEAVKENRCVDFICDVPADTCAAICGFRYDALEFEWGDPPIYYVLHPPKGEKRGLFAALFGCR
jgi:hypothetical protein